MLCWSSLGMMLSSAFQIHLHNKASTEQAPQSDTSSKKSTSRGYPVTVALLLLVAAVVAFGMTFNGDLVTLKLEGLVADFLAPDKSYRRISMISPLHDLVPSTDATTIAHILLLFYSLVVLVFPTIFLVVASAIWAEVACRGLYNPPPVSSPVSSPCSSLSVFSFSLCMFQVCLLISFCCFPHPVLQQHSFCS